MTDLPVTGTVFYGESTLTSLNDAQVSALRASSVQRDRVGTYVFEPTAQYLYIAFPQSFGEADTFEILGLDYGFVETSVDVTIDDEPVPYFVYRSTDLVTASDELSVNELSADLT